MEAVTHVRDVEGVGGRVARPEVVRCARDRGCLVAVETLEWMAPACDDVWTVSDYLRMGSASFTHHHVFIWEAEIRVMGEAGTRVSVCRRESVTPR